MSNLTDAPMLIGTSRAKKAISLTALIDVVFILLMFFMLTSTFIKWHNVELQTASASNVVITEQNKADSQLIILKAKNQFSLLTTSLVNGKHEQNFDSLAQLIIVLDSSLATVLLPEPHIEVQLITASLLQLKTENIINVTLGNVLSVKGENTQ